MSTWYQSKVKYGQMVDGKVKVVSELYLHEAVNFGEVETQCYSNLKTRIKEMNVDAIAKSTYGEVVFYAGTTPESYVADPFFKIVINTDEKHSYLIPAKDAEQAIARALKAHGYGDKSQIAKVDRTEVLAIWHPHNELWQGDWWNRMELLLELKKCSWDLNQTEAFNPDGSAKETNGNTETGLVIRNNVVEVDAEELSNNDAPTDTLRPIPELPEGRDGESDDEQPNDPKPKNGKGKNIEFYTKADNEEPATA